jgi:hypothetical protein
MISAPSPELNSLRENGIFRRTTTTGAKARDDFRGLTRP